MLFHGNMWDLGGWGGLRNTRNVYPDLYVKYKETSWKKLFILPRKVLFSVLFCFFFLGPWDFNKALFVFKDFYLPSQKFILISSPWNVFKIGITSISEGVLPNFLKLLNLSVLFLKPVRELCLINIYWELTSYQVWC